MGGAYITAWAALVNGAKIQAGETVLILASRGRGDRWPEDGQVRLGS
jgi:NADPH-dependent curcumin reductase CurA